MMVVVMLGLCAVPGWALTLVDSGAARCVIVLPAGEQPLLQPAAEDLQACLRKMSGAEVRIVAGAAPAGVTAILLFLDAYSFGGKYRRSDESANKAQAVAAAEAYVQPADRLKGTLTVGRAAHGFVQAGLDALQDPGTEFTKAGPFTYFDDLNDGEKSFQAKSRSGYSIGTYGLCLAANATGEIVDDLRAAGGLKFEDARLQNMHLSLPTGGHNSIEVSRDGDNSWVVAHQDVHMAGGSAEYDLPARIAGAQRFLLKFKVQSGGAAVPGHRPVGHQRHHQVSGNSDETGHSDPASQGEKER